LSGTDGRTSHGRHRLHHRADQGAGLATRFAPVAPVVVALVLSTLTACASQTRQSPALTVVTSTDVWADVVRQVAGGLAGREVDVSALIPSGEDPHAYEATPRNRVDLSRADIVVENGGGYDDFVHALLRAGQNHPVELDAVTISGKHAMGGSLNEHVWYDLQSVDRVARAVADAMAARDPDQAATFRANVERFGLRLVALEHQEDAIGGRHSGQGVAITEPVPLYLLQACGLVNRTPAAFSAAIEDGTDVSPRVLHQTLALFTGHVVRLLVYNEETEGVATQRVLAAARSSGIPTVAVTETLPAGAPYLSWMSGILDAVDRALSP
jgi:zinc/manganese transport system substrate-binding protein